MKSKIKKKIKKDLYLDYLDFQNKVIKTTLLSILILIFTVGIISAEQTPECNVYDLDNNGCIHLDETVKAINDYFNNEIGLQTVISVITCYYEEPCCFDNNNCADGYFCLKPLGCGKVGRCQKIADTCPGLLEPVTGCDANLYKNELCAYSSGVSVDKFDECNILIPTACSNEIEIAVHNLVNIEREKAGLNKLLLDEQLSEIARNHSKDMVINDFFSHINLDGQSPTERGLEDGYVCRKDYGSYYTYGIAENLFQTWLYSSVTYYNGEMSYNWLTVDEIASKTVQKWMKSSGHRQNILNSDYIREGIGVAVSSDYKVYITEDFC